MDDGSIHLWGGRGGGAGGRERGRNVSHEDCQQLLDQPHVLVWHRHVVGSHQSILVVGGIDQDAQRLLDPCPGVSILNIS
jgi:hypothetical protein